MQQCCGKHLYPQVTLRTERLSTQHLLPQHVANFESKSKLGNIVTCIVARVLLLARVTQFCLPPIFSTLFEQTAHSK